MTRAPSAYFLFAEAVRAQVQAELQAENPEAKISVATLGKAIGERWRALSDEQKQHYKTLAAEKAVEAGAPLARSKEWACLLWQRGLWWSCHWTPGREDTVNS